MLLSKEVFLDHFKPWRKWVFVVALFLTVWDVGLTCIVGGVCRNSLITSYLIIWLAFLPIAAVGAVLHILLKPVVLWLKTKRLLFPVCIGLTVVMVFIWWDFFKVLLLVWIGFAILTGGKRLRTNDVRDEGFARENRLARELDHDKRELAKQSDGEKQSEQEVKGMSDRNAWLG